jgi:hypothetical protein
MAGSLLSGHVSKIFYGFLWDTIYPDIKKDSLRSQ